MKKRSTFVGGFIASLTLSAAILAGCSEESDQGASAGGSAGYPEQPIQVVVPAGAGGDTDLNTRLLGKHLEEELGQSIVVSNVNGSGGSVGTRQVMEAEADGYTALSFHDSLLLNNIFGLTDYTYSDYKMAGMGVTDAGNGFFTSKNSKFKDAASLVEYAKANPGEVTVATEMGSLTYIQLLAFQEETGTELNIVDVGGAADKITALLGGRVDIVPTSLGLVKSYVDSGDFIPLGIMAEERLEGAPDVPTFKEQGIDVVFDKVFYFAFPKETPDEVVNTFSDALQRVVENEEYQKAAQDTLLNPVFTGPEETVQILEEKAARYQELYENSEK